MAKTAKEAAKTETKKAEVKEPKPMKEIVSVKPGALSTDVGPAILAGLDKSYKDEAKANELMQGVEAKRYDMLAQLTNAILKAANADDSIDLSKAFTGNRTDMNTLNDQLGLALGFREVTEVEAKDGSMMQRIGTSKACLKYWPGPKDDSKSPEGKRKNTLRTNFLHMIKKCAQAASGIQAKGIKVATDKDSGTLRISGPAVVKEFGHDNVVLNEKQIVGEGEGAVKLVKKPSFTAVAQMGAAAAGKVLEIRKDSRVASNATDPGVAVQTICKSLVDACSKLKLPADDETKRELSKAQSAIDKVLQAK